jgi:Raf kinase inhibitor-like YbhB/YbcL family protein
MALTLEISAFADQQPIPARHSREGGNISPPIGWRDEPRGTRSLALVVEDPDAPKGTFRHWAAYNIPPGSHRLPEGAGCGSGATAMRMATNDFGNARYDGPQPPPGHGAHHYHFKLFALDVTDLGLPAHAAAQDVLAAARAHALDSAEIVGTFER